MLRELDVGQSALLTDIAMCINYYRLFSPGLYCCVHATVQLDEGPLFCPGIIVQVNYGQFKQCDAGDRFIGPPNFILDVFPGDDLLDYEHRHECFERARVIEYVAVRLTEPVEWIWNRLIDGKFSVIETADNELIMSTALPGLWIPTYALKHRDWWAIMGAIARGVSRVGHHDFMDTIWKPGKSPAGEVERIEADRLNTLDVSESSGQSTTCTLPPGIVSWYKAEGNANDAVGSNHGTTFAVTYGHGKVDRAFQFDGSGFVRVPDAPSLNSPAITVEAWVKSSGEGTTAQGRYRYLVAKGIDPDAASYALYTGHSGGLFFFVYDGKHFVLSSDAGPLVWDGKWHHVAGSFDGTTVRLYVDGNQVGYGTPAALKINYNMPGGNDLFIGNYFWPGTWGFTGSIDELSIYRRALSASEIQAIYRAGSAGKSNGPAPATPRAGEAERIEADRLNTLDDSESSGQSTTCTLPSGIVSWYKAEDNADDAVGNNHGTADGITYGPGVVGRAFQFDGEGYVRVPDAASLNSPAITVEAWVKSSGEGTTAQGVYRYLVAKGVYADEAASYGLYTGCTGGLFFYVYDRTLDAAVSPGPGPGIWDGKWHHVAGTFDGATVRLYIDGKQVGNGAPAALNIDYHLPDGNDLFIGTVWPHGARPAHGTRGFTGSIDELSIYNRALSASEIETIYSAGGAGKSNRSAQATSGGVVDP